MEEYPMIHVALQTSILLPEYLKSTKQLLGNNYFKNDPSTVLGAV